MKKIVERIAVAGIIIQDGKVLILQRGNSDEYLPGLWEIPSGKREPSEKTIDGCKREVGKETGLEVEVGKMVGSFKYRVEKSDETRDVTQINFLVKPIGEVKVKLSSEHKNYAWIREDEIDKYNISKETKEIIKKSFQV